jgi:hypothetical protein
MCRKQKIFREKCRPTFYFIILWITWIPSWYKDTSPIPKNGTSLTESLAEFTMNLPHDIQFRGFYLRIADGSQSSYCWTRIPGMIKTLLLVHSIKRWLASVLWPIIYRVFFIMVNVKSNRQLECLHLYSTKNALSFLTGIRWRTRCNYVPRSLCSPTT